MEKGEIFMKTSFKRLLRDQGGQSMTEYILMLAIVVMIIVKLKGTLVPKLTEAMGTIGGTIDSTISQTSSGN
jgi:hypothetical protein